MIIYEKLERYLKDKKNSVEDAISFWNQNTHEYWRREFRDRYKTDNSEVIDYLNDIKLCYKTLNDNNLKNNFYMADSFIHITSGNREQLKIIYKWMLDMMDYPHIYSSIGMLSNWIGPLIDNPEIYKLKKQEILELLERLKSYPEYELNTVFYILLSQQNKIYLKQIVPIIMSYNNVEKVTELVLAMKTHTNNKSDWNERFNKLLGITFEIDLPYPPSYVKRKERAHQAWWRYPKDMKESNEYNNWKTLLDTIKHPDKGVEIYSISY